MQGDSDTQMTEAIKNTKLMGKSIYMAVKVKAWKLKLYCCPTDYHSVQYHKPYVLTAYDIRSIILFAD
jgi:hypothetical protein